MPVYWRKNTGEGQRFDWWKNIIYCREAYECTWIGSPAGDSSEVRQFITSPSSKIYLLTNPYLMRCCGI